VQLSRFALGDIVVQSTHLDHWRKVASPAKPGGVTYIARVCSLTKGKLLRKIFGEDVDE
jgi:hypothetical protein